MYKLVHLIRRDLLVQKRQRTIILPALMSAAAAVILPNSPAFAVGMISEEIENTAGVFLPQGYRQRGVGPGYLLPG